jgi:DNA-binding response OmpR family regulator
VGSNEDRICVLRYTLEINRYAVTAVLSAADSLSALAARQWDLMIVELPLDGLDDVLSRKSAFAWHGPSVALFLTMTSDVAALDVDARLPRGIATAELLDRIKVMTARKRGPLKGTKKHVGPAQVIEAEKASAA